MKDHKPTQTTLTNNDAVKQATAHIKDINSGAGQVFHSTVFFIKERGHEALGFKTPNACLAKKAPSITKSYASRLTKSSSIYLKIDPNCKHLDKVRESTIRPLTQLSESDAKKVFKHAVAESEGHLINAKDIRRLIQDLGLEANSTQQTTFSTLELNDTLHQALQDLAQQYHSKLLKYHPQNRADWLLLVKWLNKELSALCPAFEHGVAP